MDKIMKSGPANRLKPALKHLTWIYSVLLVIFISYLTCCRRWRWGREVVWGGVTLCWLTCSVTDSRLTRSRKWRWNLKHLHPPSGEPAPFKVNYTSESSLFIITRQTNSGCQSGQKNLLTGLTLDDSHAHQEQRVIIIWLIVPFSHLFRR